MDSFQEQRRKDHLETLDPQQRAAFLAREQYAIAAARAERAARRMEGRLRLFGHSGGKGFGFDE